MPRGSGTLARKHNRRNGDEARGSQSTANRSQKGLVTCSALARGENDRSNSVHASSASSQTAKTAYVAVSASCGRVAQTENASARQTPSTDTPQITAVPVSMSTGSTPPSEVRMASTGKPQAMTPSTVISREASRPRMISASDRSVTIMIKIPPRNLSWQMAPAVTAGTIARASISSSPMIDRTKLDPAAARSWYERASKPLNRLSQTTIITASTPPTSMERPAYTCQRRLVVRQSAANTGPKPQRGDMTNSSTGFGRSQPF